MDPTGLVGHRLRPHQRHDLGHYGPTCLWQAEPQIERMLLPLKGDRRRLVVATAAHHSGDRGLISARAPAHGGEIFLGAVGAFAMDSYAARAWGGQGHVTFHAQRRSSQRSTSPSRPLKVILAGTPASKRALEAVGRHLGGLHSTCPSALVQTAGWKRGIIPHCMNDPQLEGHMASYIERRKFCWAGRRLRGRSRSRASPDDTP